MGTKKITPEIPTEFSKSVRAVAYDWKVADEEHMKLEKECRHREQSFTTNIPRTWVKKVGSLDTHAIKDMDIDLAAIQRIVDNDVCENCNRNH